MGRRDHERLLLAIAHDPSTRDNLSSIARRCRCSVRSWTVAQATFKLGISRAFAYKWRALGDSVYAQIVALRHATADGPARIAAVVPCAASTVYRTRRKHGLHRLDHLDRITRTVVRYERSRPGELLHLDVKQLWRIPDGGGRFERILTDNALNYRARAFHAVAAAHGIVLKRTRPYRPQTNGNAERAIQTLLREWAYRRPYDNNRARLDALDLYQHHYNHSRPHAALGHRPPISRVCQQPV